jgi:uncharacterized sulfatase
MKAIYFILVITLSASIKNAVSAQPKYNVLFIAVDDMNDKCVLFGNKEAVSPNLQRLAAHGMVFTSAYAQFPLCNPSRTSVLSGLRPDRTRVKNNSTRPRDVMGNSVVFLPEYFRQNGYRTERYGKIMHGSFENDISWDYAEPAETNDNTDLLPAGKQDSHSSEVRWFVGEDTVVLKEDTLTGHLIASMQQYNSKPFFYGLGLEQTHLAFKPSLKQWNRNGDSSVSQLLKSSWTGDYNGLRGNGSSNIPLPNTLDGDRNDVPEIAFREQIVLADTEWRNMIHAYYSDVSSVDEQLGRVLDELDRQHLWDKTVVVFWSDHGQHLGEHEGCWRKNTLFEESLHVPLIVCVPGKTPGVCSRLVELVDLYPTLSEVLRIACA